MAGSPSDSAPSTGRHTDWEHWMRGMGRYTRRLREMAGLSQEQLARLAGVSQGAVSRLEAGRAVNTPLIVVMKINSAMRQALTALGPDKLSEETRRLMELPARAWPPSEDGFDTLSIARDPLLSDLVQLFWNVPVRYRAGVVEVVRAVAALLTGSGKPRGD
jgi:transcriptional regulator with XRE-family HTH domain